MLSLEADERRQIALPQFPQLRIKERKAGTVLDSVGAAREHVDREARGEVRNRAGVGKIATRHCGLCWPGRGILCQGGAQRRRLVARRFFSLDALLLFGLRAPLGRPGGSLGTLLACGRTCDYGDRRLGNGWF